MSGATSGWCVHGVAYGPNWACGQCSPSSDPVNFTTRVNVIAWTPEKVERVLFLLQRIANELEQARLRR